jgi:hypothetical protein
MNVVSNRTPDEDRRWEAFIEETMRIFHMNRSEAVAVGVSMMIRQCMLAAQVAEVVA